MKTGTELETGCLLPLAQSAVTAVLAGVLGGALAEYAGWQSPALVGCIAGSLAGAGWWVSSIVAWRRAAYPAPIQQITPTSPVRAEPVRVVISRENGADLIDLPASEAQVIALAQGVLSGGSLSEASWTGSGGIFTRAEFSRLRDELIRRGLAVWKNPHTPARGVSLTAPGRAVMRRFAAMSPTPLSGTVEKRRG